MILRKPYAFFIKHFKLFHFIIFILSSILLYRTTLIYNFLKEFVIKTPNVIGKELTDSLFSFSTYGLIVLLILINIIIISVMIKKSKPFMYYMINITLYLFVFVMNIIANKTIGNLEIMIVSPKTTMAVRDFLNIARMLQTISVIFYLVRATGFDIRKFDFRRDLQDLNISEEDSEEYELAVSFEPNVIIRNLKRNIRKGKYYYRENKFMINIIIGLSIAAILFIWYAKINKYDKIYKQNDFFQTETLNFGVKESYILTNDYKGDKLTDSTSALLVLKISTSSLYNQTLSESKMALKINDTKYYPYNINTKSLIDLGIIYNNQKIEQTFKDYLLVYKVPKEEVNSKIIFEYVDNIESKRGKTVVNTLKVKIEPEEIEENKIKIHEYTKGNTISTITKNNNDYKITINDIEIQNKYTKLYQNCTNKNECHEYKEVIVSNQTSEQEKTLLKINGSIIYENKISDINTIVDFIKYFGRLEYIVNGVKYTEKSDFSEVKFTRVTDDNYYINVNKDLEKATEIKLIFKIRNNEYIYTLRGENIDE